MLHTSSLITVLALAVAALAQDFSVTFDLTPEAETLGGNTVVPSADADELMGSGSATVTYDSTTGILEWTVDFEGLTSDTTAMNFHGPATRFMLGEGQVMAETEAFVTPSTGTADISQEQARDLLDGFWYLNIHTETNPDGEIRGQVTDPLEVITYTFDLSPEAETFGGTPLEEESTGSGTAVVMYDPNTSLLSWNIEFEGLTSDTTMAHFHGPASRVATAGVEVTIEDATFTSPSVGSTMIDADDAVDLLSGLWYVNIHTANNPNGELRGQVADPLDVISYEFDLSPDAEVLGGTALVVDSEDGSGAATVEYDPNTSILSWTISYESLTSDTTMAHFHGPASRLEVGEVEVTIEAATFASPSVGSTTIDADQANDLLDGLWYVNIHTDSNAAGEIRGQVADPLETFTASFDLTTAAEVLGTTALLIEAVGTGTATVDYDPNTALLSWDISFDGLSSDTTMAHFHGPAERDATGGVEVTIEAATFTSPSVGSATIDAGQAADLLAGLWYVNIHTDSNPDGEIRGQVAEEELFSELVYLTTRAEIFGGTPLDVDSTGSGTAQVDFDPETLELTWTIEYEGLSSDTTAAHFHGPAGVLETAGVQITIEAATFDSGSTGSAILTSAQADELLAGMWYVNVHTTDNPNGELRGQVVALSALSEVIYLTSRAEEVGGTALVEESFGAGMAQVDFDPDTLELTWEITYELLTSDTSMAHFHGPATALETAGVEVSISDVAFDSPTSGSAMLTSNQVHDLLAGLWYINVHTELNTAGELRGQVVEVPVFMETIPLTTDAEIAGGTPLDVDAPRASGSAVVTFDPDSLVLTWTLTYADLSSETTQAHFHGTAEADATAEVEITIEDGQFDSPSTGSVMLTQTQAHDLLAGLWYINVHTELNPNGELRGQVVIQDDMVVDTEDPDDEDPDDEDSDDEDIDGDDPEITGEASSLAASVITTLAASTILAAAFALE